MVGFIKGAAALEFKGTRLAPPRPGGSFGLTDEAPADGARETLNLRCFILMSDVDVDWAIGGRGGRLADLSVESKSIEAEGLCFFFMARGWILVSFVSAETEMVAVSS